MLKNIILAMVLFVGFCAATVWADEALNKALLKTIDIMLVKELITKGADVNAKDDKGRTLLHITAFYGEGLELAELLISKGADVNAKANSFLGGGATPLLNAAEMGRTELVKLLISKGADVNALSQVGHTPLLVAAENGRNEIAGLLMSKGADVNAKDHLGMTPLHYAAKYGKKEVVELLISNGADLNAKNSSGKTLLDIATEYNKNEVVSLLQIAFQNQKEMAGLLQAALQNNKGNQRKTFNRASEAYKGRVMPDDIRSPFMAISAKLRPAPVVPEEARRYLVRGNALLQNSKSPNEARDAVQEYRNALLIAPWWDDAYFNLSKAQELAGDLDGSVSSMQYYLLTEPKDKRESQDRLYALEAKRDKVKSK